MSDNRLRCESCGKSHFEVPIIEKPLRFAFKVKVYNLPQNNKDGRKQDNICVNCFNEEVNKLKH